VCLSKLPLHIFCCNYCDRGIILSCATVGRYLASTYSSDVNIAGYCRNSVISDSSQVPGMKDLYLLEDNSRLQNGTHQVCGAQEAEFKICETSAICSDFNAMLLKYFLLSSHIFEYLDEGLFVGFSFRIVFVLLDFGPRALKNVKRVVSCGFGCLELCRFDPWDASSGAYLVVFFLVLKLVLKVFSMFKLFKTHKHLRMIKLLKLLKWVFFGGDFRRLNVDLSG